MHSVIRIAMLIWLALSAPLFAQSKPVVVELFTSQGCSSCPPADEMMHQLAKRDDVIALALHVDYWDYIGWKDSFADPAYTKRQKTYARAFGNRSVFTPQFMIGGTDSVIGPKAMELSELINAHARKPYPVDLRATRRGGKISVTAAAVDRNYGDMVLQLVTYSASQTVSIKRGENAGRTLSYSNVVNHWEEIARWRGANDLSVRVSTSGNQPTALILQEAKSRVILGAVALR
ncbi:DUF1223 domain-containing protein [Actibacterium pelagium]|uniref:Secreted protein n=1 Tax=Actibacterium pelagium TaxID=2029103 RepID=A0A917EIT0_9RHOB|nr:DUF1223 domain-containing protein [Actibacterium pelagium]GGE40247.1 hypothetical protein GCM10011517_04970 [Actibacterium pelagium]